MSLPPDSNRTQPDHAPTPYSADDIRRACGPGRRNTYRIEAKGEQPYLMATEWFGGGAKTGEASFTKLDLDGETVAGPGRTEMEWRDLQKHASYPGDVTTIEETTVEVGAGEFAVWLYTVRRDDLVERVWFAKDLPGPPVLKIDERDGAEESRMELIELARA